MAMSSLVQRQSERQGIFLVALSPLERGAGGGMAMSSLVQRQSERQGIFLVALSPLERGAGGVKYQPYLLSSIL